DVLMVSREWGEGLVSLCVYTVEALSASLWKSPRGARLCPGRLVFFMELAEFCWWLHGHAYGAPEQGVQGFDPEHLALKDSAEVAGDGFGDGVEVEFLAELLLHGGDQPRGDAAGDAQVEVAEIG